MPAETTGSGTWDPMLLWYGTKILKTWYQCLQFPAWPNLRCAPWALSVLCVLWMEVSNSRKTRAKLTLEWEPQLQEHQQGSHLQVWCKTLAPRGLRSPGFRTGHQTSRQQGLARACSIYGNNGVSDKHNPLLPKAGQTQSPAWSLPVKGSRWALEGCWTWQSKLILVFALTTVFHFWWTLVLLDPHFCKIQIVPPRP